MNIRELAIENQPLLIEMRRHIHQNPELSSVEYKTLQYIKDKLKQFNIEYIEVPDGGILGFIGDKTDKKTVLLRADIDALPIQENKRNLKREKVVVSENTGVQHACGHDAHTAMLLTAGKILQENKSEINGRVILLFERGEEGGGNIRQILTYIEEEHLKIDGAHAIHLNPGINSGKFIAQNGPVMAGGAGFSVTISGRDGHGSRPDIANNPLDCFVSIYEAVNNIRLKHISPFESFTFSIGQLSGGTRGNVIARDITFGGSGRFFKTEVGTRFVEEFKNILENITKAYHCTYQINYLFTGFPLINNEQVVEIAQKNIRTHLGKEVLVSGVDPSMGSESFSIIARLYPSIMIFLGIANEELGTGADIHTEYFDVDEGALHLGVAETIGFALGFLNNTEPIPFAQYQGKITDLLKFKSVT
jgi:amidohydrolase